MKLHYVDTKEEVDFTDRLFFKSDTDLNNFLKYNPKYEYKETIECNDISLFYEKHRNMNKQISDLQLQIQDLQNEMKEYISSNEFYINYHDEYDNETALDVGNVEMVACGNDINAPYIQFYGRKIFGGNLDRLYEYHKNLSFQDDGLKSLKNRKENLVYFVGDSVSKVVKIGFSSDISSRIQSLQTGYPRKLEVFKVIEGDKKLESKLHKKFEKYRLNGEWFELSNEILEFVS